MRIEKMAAAAVAAAAAWQPSAQFAELHWLAGACGTLAVCDAATLEAAG